MNKNRILIIPCIAVALGVGLYLANRFWIVPLASRQAHGTNVEADAKHPMAPDFSLKGINGETIHLADYRGKVVMIDFWATDCDPCRGEIPGFVQLQDRYRDQGFAIVGISLDAGPEPVRDFYKEFKINYAVGLNPGDLDQRYGVTIGIPTTFIVGRDGRIYAKHVGAADPSVFEEEIKPLLAETSKTELISPKPAVAGLSN